MTNFLGLSRRPNTPEPKKHRIIRRIMLAAGLLVLAWVFAAYVALPFAWTHYEHRPKMVDAPKFSVTPQGIPGDPLNLGLIGTEANVVQAMLAAGWNPADAISWKTSLGIARSVLEKRPYPDAPVSSLFVFGHRQDLAFEKAAGKSASRRHHVRFWRSDDLGEDCVPFWCGAATFDRSVGLSHLTGQITHHIAPDIDLERDATIASLRAAGWLAREYQVTGVGATMLGRNGGGDRYHTDGELTIGVLARPGGESGHSAGPEALDNPAPVQIKDQLWSAIRPLLQSIPGQGD